MEIRRLDRDDQVDHFACGDSELDTYLQRFAWKHQEKRLYATTYVAVEEAQPHIVLGYYTLSTTSVPRRRLPESMTAGLPKFDHCPAVLLGSFAVDGAHSGHGIGKKLLRDAVLRSYRYARNIGARFLMLEVRPNPAAIHLYKEIGFIELPPAEGDKYRIFVLDLLTVGKGLEMIGKV